MWSFFSHLSHIASGWTKFVFHWTYFNFFIKRCLSNQVFLIDFTYCLSPQQWSHFRHIFPFLAVNIKIFSFCLMEFVGFLLLLKGMSFIIDFSLSKYTRFNEYLFLSSRIQIDFYSVVSFSLLLTALILFVEVGVIEFISNFRIKLRDNFALFRSKYPFWHLRKCFFALSSKKVVIQEIIISLAFCILFPAFFAS